MYTLFALDPGASSITTPDPNSTTGDMDLTSFSSFGEKKDLRCRPGRVPKFKLWLKPKLVVGIVEFVGGLIGLVTVPVEVNVNRECRWELESQWWRTRPVALPVSKR